MFHLKHDKEKKNPTRTQLSPPLAIPGNSKLPPSPHFFINPSNGRVSQRLTGWVPTSSYPPISHLLSCALHCPAASQALFFHLICFQASSPHFLPCSYSYTSLCCLFFYSRLCSCIICTKCRSSEHILLTRSAFLRGDGEGAGGFSHSHSYTIMITLLT